MKYRCRHAQKTDALKSVASDGHPGNQDGSKMAQEDPKRGPREPQDDSKSAPRRVLEAILEAPEGQC
eukprot:7329382-Pyramimonas_sp.AAC.1